MPPTSAALLSTSLALLYLVLRSRVATVDASAFQRLKSWEPQVAAALAAAVLARAAAATDAVARVAPGGRFAGAPRMAVACGVTLLATAGGRGGIGPASAAWLLAAAASAALLWSWDETEERDVGDDDGGAETRRSGSRRSAVVETTPAALSQELDAEAEASSREARAAGKEGKSKSKSSGDASENSPSPLVAVLFYDPRGGSRAAAVCAAFDVLSEEEDGEEGARAERPLVVYRRVDASRWPGAAAELGARWEGGEQQPPSLPAVALFRGGQAVASAPGEGGRLPASVGGLRRVLRV